MKKLILLVFCTLAIGISAQQKKSKANTSVSKSKGAVKSHKNTSKSKMSNKNVAAIPKKSGASSQELEEANRKLKEAEEKINRMQYDLRKTYFAGQSVYANGDEEKVLFGMMGTVVPVIHGEVVNVDEDFIVVRISYFTYDDVDGEIDDSNAAYLDGEQLAVDKAYTFERGKARKWQIRR